jgi:hypothetical protein
MLLSAIQLLYMPVDAVNGDESGRICIEADVQCCAN